MSEFRPGAVWPDNNGVPINAHGGGLLLHEGTYYWFGEHKIEGAAGNANWVGVHVYSSNNLYDWTDRGIALSPSDDPGSPIVRGNILERPKVVYNKRTNSFVMWFHVEAAHNNYAWARSGVAISKSPTGPYEFLAAYRPDKGRWPELDPDLNRTLLGDAEVAALGTVTRTGGPSDRSNVDLVCRRDYPGGQMARDMTVFVDDDGAAYHVFASEENGTLHISLLNDEYTSHTGRYVRIYKGEYREAPALFKRRGKYYLISSWCTGWTPNPAKVAVADSIWGPWEDLGDPCRGAPEERATTFHSQSTYVVASPDNPEQFIYLGDRWRPENAIDGRYIWLPIRFDGDKPYIGWLDAWNLSALG